MKIYSPANRVAAGLSCFRLILRVANSPLRSSIGPKSTVSTNSERGSDYLRSRSNLPCSMRNLQSFRFSSYLWTRDSFNLVARASNSLRWPSSFLFAKFFGSSIRFSAKKPYCGYYDEIINEVTDERIWSIQQGKNIERLIPCERISR